ncbi:FAD/NAD(P)-binding domain-containing protein [Aureobasidium pullulans]|uniref:FAD/NAD(P)-binding domain-containing protein n=1 Tax=Aureobasidium pullulans TaxID=5580 RepID=A0A4S9WSE4_AURPU|nr:FAD/NAD(P)-binding domain-containing protein [Aureobasidium pullulans]
MRQFLQTLLIAITLAAPLFKYPPYAAAVFTLVVIWNHLFPSEQPNPEVLLLPTKIPYLAALKPLDDPTPHIGEHCPTCWEELGKDNKPTKLVCGHVYCNSCLLEWIDSGKNTCPICKKVLFQQPLFTGKEAIAAYVHRLRICFVVLGLLITFLRQILAFIACHPAKWEYMRWEWSYLNPFSYLTSYGSWPKDIGAIAVVIFDITQLGYAKYGVKVFGPAWFKIFPGHWAFYAIPGHDGSLEPGNRILNFVWYHNCPDDFEFQEVMTDISG